jgi:pilus assembly protein Flp/PilA
MPKLVLRFVNDNTGVTSIEYALIAGSLSILIIAGVTGIGTTVKGTFHAVAHALR